jgi:threonine/homoserine/homoserine lactone efflux protein
VPAPSTLALFTLAALALIAIPGPNMVFVATRAVSEGRRSGLWCALGLETGTIIHVCAAAAGLSALIASSATAFDALRYLGAAYLVFLGIKALRRRPATGEDATPAPVSLGRAYRQAIVVQLLNPKVALFFLAFLPQFLDPARGPVWSQVLVLGAILGVLGFFMDCAYAIVSAAAAGKLRGRGGGGGKVTGTVYLVLGAAAALSGGRH